MLDLLSILKIDYAHHPACNESCCIRHPRNFPTRIPMNSMPNCFSVVLTRVFIGIALTLMAACPCRSQFEILQSMMANSNATISEGVNAAGTESVTAVPGRLRRRRRTRAVHRLQGGRGCGRLCSRSRWKRNRQARGSHRVTRDVRSDVLP